MRFVCRAPFGLNSFETAQVFTAEAAGGASLALALALLSAGRKLERSRP